MNCRKKVKHFSNSFLMIMDEIKIQENLVWDKHRSELNEYFVESNYATLYAKPTNVATHFPFTL